MRHNGILTKLYDVSFGICDLRNEINREMPLLGINGQLRVEASLRDHAIAQKDSTGFVIDYKLLNDIVKPFIKDVIDHCMFLFVDDEYNDSGLSDSYKRRNEKIMSIFRNMKSLREERFLYEIHDRDIVESTKFDFDRNINITRYEIDMAELFDGWDLTENKNRIEDDSLNLSFVLEFTAPTQMKDCMIPKFDEPLSYCFSALHRVHNQTLSETCDELCKRIHGHSYTGAVELHGGLSMNMKYANIILALISHVTSVLNGSLILSRDDTDVLEKLKSTFTTSLDHPIFSRALNKQFADKDNELWTAGIYSGHSIDPEIPMKITVLFYIPTPFIIGTTVEYMLFMICNYVLNKIRNEAQAGSGDALGLYSFLLENQKRIRFTISETPNTKYSLSVENILEVQNEINNNLIIGGLK